MEKSLFLAVALDGAAEGGVEGVVVQVDGVVKETARDGSFAFNGVGRGEHRVSARVAKRDAYFTTPSHVEAQPGDVVRFGVAFTPARLFGRVVSDAGDGVASVGITSRQS